jgi:hypothetical protein
MRWRLSNRADPEARVIADRHYNRQHVGAPQFVPPGRCLVLKCEGAFWVTSWPFAEWVKHEWAGAWVCSAFRREVECEHLASDLVRDAVAATRAQFGEPPPLGMITFVDAGKVRRKRDPGRCFRRAGFVEVGRTKDAGLVALQLLPGAMPEAAPAQGRAALAQMSLFSNLAPEPLAGRNRI